MHVVLSLSTFPQRGHFIKGTPHPTLEITIRESAEGPRRKTRNDLGIALIEP
jgi:uncharacterized protein